MRTYYLLLAVVGTIVPYYFFIDFFTSHGIHLGRFVQGLFVNGAAGGFAADVLITSVVFWLWMQHRRTQDPAAPAPWLFIALNLSIGLSCALPAYLYATHPRN